MKVGCGRVAYALVGLLCVGSENMSDWLLRIRTYEYFSFVQLNLQNMVFPFVHKGALCKLCKAQLLVQLSLLGTMCGFLCLSHKNRYCYLLKVAVGVHVLNKDKVK